MRHANNNTKNNNNNNNKNPCRMRANDLNRPNSTLCLPRPPHGVVCAYLRTYGLICSSEYGTLGSTGETGTVVSFPRLSFFLGSRSSCFAFFAAFRRSVDAVQAIAIVIIPSGTVRWLSCFRFRWHFPFAFLRETLSMFPSP